MEGKLHLEVDGSVSTVVMPPHRVAVSLKGESLIDSGVLTKVEESTKWVSSAVVTAKSNGNESAST